MKKFTRIVSFLLVLCMVLSIAPALSFARAADTDADLWVDPVNGSDSNDGTTEDKALKTIDAAKTKAAELSANGDVVVILMAGTYDATETIEFGAAESGKNGNTITYRAASGETALISGGTELDGWTLHDAAHNIYVTDIPKGAELTRQFYVDGEPQPVASMELTPTDLSAFTSTGFRSAAIASEDYTHYLTIDLGEGKLVSSVTLYGDSETSATTGKAMGFPKDFTIQTSADGYTWTTQVTETNYTAPNALGGVEFVFNSTAARYIKINATKLGNPGTNTQTSASQYRLAFAEVQVGFTSKANSVNLGIAQHTDLSSSIASASNVSLTANNPYTVAIGSATAVGGVTFEVASTAVGTTDNIKIQAYTNGVWKTVYTKNGYTWKASNTFAINPVAATKIRVVTATDLTVTALTVHKPAELSGTATVGGSNASVLVDNAFGSSYNGGSQTSAIFTKDIIVNLGSVQDVGGVRLYPTYNGTEVAGYMTSARIQVSTDGTTYHTVLELADIQTPTGGAQLLVLPKGYKAQYVKIQPMMLTGEGEYSLQLDELDIVPSAVDAIKAEDDVPNYVTKKNYNKISWDGATPTLGYYADVNNMTGAPTYYEVESGTVVGEEAACIIRGTEGSRGYTGWFQYSELVANGGTKVPAFYVELASAATFNSLELMTDNDVWGGPLNFSIEAYDGTQWVEIVRDTNPGWTARQDYTNIYEFNTITATAVRVLAYDLATMTGATPSASDTQTRFILDELTLYNATEYTYIEEEILDSETTVYDEFSLSGANVLGFGYYNASMDNLTSWNQNNAANMFDGKNDTYGSTNGQQYQWMPDWGGGNLPALLLNVTKKSKPATINAIELVVREDGLCAPYDFVIQVNTSADKENWVTVAKGEEVEWKNGNKALYKFAEMDVYQVRLVATNLTPATAIPKEEWKEAVTTYMQICEFSIYNIYDPENPVAADLVTQGEGSVGSVKYVAKGATSSSSNSISYNPNRAIDGVIEPLQNAGWYVTSDAKYNFSYLKHPEHVEMHSLYIWYHRIQHITGASGDGTELYMEGGLGTQKGEALEPTWLSNDYMFIDTPGEWYIDRYEGKIYYMADGTMDGKVAYLPVTEKIVNMEYASNITFEGITFSHTSFTFPSENEYLDQQANAYFYGNTYVQVPGGIDVLGCKNVIFDGCEISNMGTAGIRIRSDGDGQSDGCQVINSLIRDISYNGITIGQIHAHHGYQSWMLVKNTVIRNNYVTRIGLDMYDSVGIYAAYTYGTIIDHNEVAYTPYTGISLGWGWDQEEKAGNAAVTEVGNNKITNNIIHDTCKTNRDGGAIYTLGTSRGTEISGNYIYNFGDGGPNGEIGIYLDEGSAYINITNNVMAGSGMYWMQMYFNNIHDNTWKSNYYTSNLRSRNYTTGNSVSGSTSIQSVASNASAAAIAKDAGLTDPTIKEGQDNGFWFRQDIYQEYWSSSDYARYIDDYKGWYNVRVTGQVGRTYYDMVNKVITIVMPEGTDLSNLSLQYANESRWNVSPGTGTEHDFNTPATYTITSAGGGTTFKWTVKVIEEPAVDDTPVPPTDDPIDVPTIPTQAPTEPPKPVEGFVTGEYLQLIPESSLTPYVGDYVNGNFNTLVNQDPGEAAYLTDVGIGTAGWIGSASASGTQAAVIELGGTKKIGGVELIARQADYLKTFEIQVKKTDGTWVTVQNVTEDPFNGCRSVMYTWTPVEGTAIRVLCYSWSSSRPMLQEIAVYEAKTGNILQEVVPNSVTSPQGALTPAAVVENVIDGFRGDSAADYFQTTGVPAVLTFDLTKDGAASNVKRMVIYAHATSKYTPASIKLELQVDGTWVSVYDDYAYEGGDTDTFILDLDQDYEATSARLTVNSTIAQELVLTEVDFFGYVTNEVKEDVQLNAPTGLTVTDVTDNSITVTADTVTGGTLKYRLLDKDGEVVADWQTSGSFTGLTRYTRYTVEAMYVGSTGYLDSIATSVDQRTEKTQLPDVTGLTVVTVDETSISVTADSNANGTLQFRINKNGSWTSWGTGNSFTGLTENTTYTIEARYKGATGFNNSENTVSISATTKKADTIMVGSSYSVHLIEPWALRTNVQFAKNTQDNLIPVSNFTDYGAYAILSSKFDGTTVEELMADSDAVKYTKADGNITVKDATTLTFDFYDGLYSYNLGESVHWVAYFVTADGTYYTSVQTKSLTDVADALLGDGDVSESEKKVLQSMKDLKDAVIALRGEDANLGNVYAPGVANTGLGDRNTGYQFGTSSQIKLIEPWGIRVRVLMREKTAPGGVYADYENVDDYGVIFFHDKTGKYNGSMTAAQMSAETDAKVYSKSNGNATIVANGVTAVYDQGIYTYDLDKNLYCLPYIVVDGEYYYPANATCWNLLGEMTEYSQNTDHLSNEEIAVFKTMLEMYDNVQEHLK